MADDKRKKKRGRSRILRSCFRSFDAGAGEGLSSSDDRDSKNGLGVSGCNGTDDVDANSVKATVADTAVGSFVKRRSPRRRFSRLLKAALIDSIMAKKIRRSSSKSSIASDTSASTLSSEKIAKLSNDINANSKECTDTEDSCSRRSNLLSSSSLTTSSSYSASSSSSVNSNFRWSSEQKASTRIDSVDFRPSIPSNSSIIKKSNPINFNTRSYLDQKQSSATDSLHIRRQDSSYSQPLPRQKPINLISKSPSYNKGLSRLESLDSKNSVSSNSSFLTKLNSDKIKSGGNNWNIRWCLFLLLSLVVLVFWGRIISILCTSIWFYFVPCRRIKRVNSVTNATQYLDTDSVQYKKRVIMAGFLERTRNPIR